MLSPALLPLAVTAVAMSFPDVDDPASWDDSELRAAIKKSIESPGDRPGGPDYPKSELARELEDVFGEITAREVREQEELQQRASVERDDKAARAATAERERITAEAHQREEMLNAAIEALKRERAERAAAIELARDAPLKALGLEEYRVKLMQALPEVIQEAVEPLDGKKQARAAVRRVREYGFKLKRVAPGWISFQDKYGIKIEKGTAEEIAQKIADKSFKQFRRGNGKHK